MSKKAFTLVELLVVVAIIAVLVILFLPNLNSIKSIARASLCRNNLHQIQAACSAYEGREVRENRIANHYPPADWWPNPAPMLAVADVGMYVCPEDGISGSSVSGSSSSSGGSGNNNGGAGPGSGSGTSATVATSLQSQISQLHFHTQPGLDIPFDGSNYHCHVKDFSDHTEYWFEDLGNSENDKVGDNWSDAAFSITKIPPIKLVWMPQAACGYDNKLMMGNVTLMQDCRHWTEGDKLNTDNTVNNSSGGGNGGNNNNGGGGGGGSGSGSAFAFTFAGMSNYGINAMLNVPDVKSGTVVLLDYLYLKANNNEDMSATLKDTRAARHRGKMNVLLSDGAVLLMSPSQLDPAYPDNKDQWLPKSAE
jgi:prepilin-type N-terminal cleavage/methylation domain-containing protein